MTMPHERTRALRWGHEVLQEICDDALIADKERGGAAELLRTYASPARVLESIEADVTCIPADAAAAIERTGSLLRSIRISESCDEQVRRSLTYALRHFPEPESAGRWTHSSSACTIKDWLLPEDGKRPAIPS